MNNILKGEWSLVQWNPDIATDEVLNIGVAFTHNEKKTILKCCVILSA